MTKIVFARTVLCEKCFPDWEDYELHCSRPMGPCMQCGYQASIQELSTLKGPENGMHSFPKDPRIKDID